MLNFLKSIVRLASYKEVAIEGLVGNHPNYDWLKWFMVECDSKVVGRCSVHINGKTAWLSHAVIHPEYRGKGLYSRMIQARLDYAKQSATKAVAYCNWNSLPIMLEHGFTEVGVYQKRERILVFLSKSI